MSLSLAESQAINEIAKVLYKYLPGKAHPFANQELSFEGVANKSGLSCFWRSGSKLPSITLLLAQAFEFQRSSFCPLILQIVQSALVYRNNTNSPITKEEINELNKLIARVHFKIPELWDRSFLETLPTSKADKISIHESIGKQKTLIELKEQLLQISTLTPQPRGFAFENFLKDLFSSFNLFPRSAFRIAGEQIDGSFQINTDVYLVEAKWQREQTSQPDLLIFREKVESKATWARGLFISDSGFTEEGLKAFSRGRSTNIIGMTGQDIYFVLDGSMSLVDVINQKARRAVETGEFYTSVHELNAVRRNP